MRAAHSPRRLGMIIPSSNTVVERETPRLLPDDGSISVHYGRFRVVKISDAPSSTDQFDLHAVVAAARLLADAEVELLLWNGTAASWIGFEYDNQLVAAIEAETQVPTTTAVRAINERLQQIKAKRIGLVTPYVASLEADIVKNYRSIGIDVIAAARRGLTDNTAYARLSPAELSEMVREVGREGPDAIVIMCTNMMGASVAGPLESELGIFVLDSVAVAVEHCVATLAR